MTYWQIPIAIAATGRQHRLHRLPFPISARLGSAKHAAPTDPASNCLRASILSRIRACGRHSVTSRDGSHAIESDRVSSGRRHHLSRDPAYWYLRACMKRLRLDEPLEHLELRLRVCRVGVNFPSRLRASRPWACLRGSARNAGPDWGRQAGRAAILASPSLFGFRPTLVPMPRASTELRTTPSLGNRLP
jgi:hypothetical protein